MSKQADRQRAQAARQIHGRHRQIGSYSETSVRDMSPLVEPNQAEADELRSRRAAIADDLSRQEHPTDGKEACPACGQRVRIKKNGQPYLHGCTG